MNFTSINATIETLDLKGADIEKLLLSAIVFTLVSFSSWWVSRVAMKRWASRKPEFKSSFKNVRSAMFALCIAIGFAVAVQFLPGRFRMHPAFLYGSKLTLIAAALWLGERSLSVFFRRPGALGLQNEGSRDLAIQISRLVLIVLSFLVMLDTIGISITPLLASLGVSSIAIALALQDTLSNFFSGVYLLVDQPIRLGDYVRGPEGSEGYVRRIGWRSTRIENGSGHTVILPNSKLSSAIITNFDIPSREVNYPISFVISFDCDPEQVETITREVLNQIMLEHPAALKHLAPGFCINGPRESGIEIQVSLRLVAYTEAGSVRHAFFKLLMKRFQEIGINFAQGAPSSRKAPAGDSA